MRMTRFLRPLAPALLALMCAGAAQAEAALEPGDFLRQTQHWDSDREAFLPGANQGEGEACWQVVARGPLSVTLKHVSGMMHPSWSNDPIAPGSTDEWFDSDIFREQNPGKPPLTQIRTIFETVVSCHETS